MDIVMPKMGESVSEGTIIKWHKKKGDNVKRDEVIFEISTDKVDTEIPAPADGILSDILYNEGDTVDVGTVVAKLSENNGTETQKEELKKHTEEPEKEDEKSPENEEMNEKVQLETKHTENVNVLEVSMPKMGESVMEGTIIKWHKKVGELVKKDEVLFEISTDKVDTEVPSPEEGTLQEILVGEQETVEVGTVVAKLSVGEGKGTPLSEKSEEPKKEQKETAPKKEFEVEEEPAKMHENFTNIKAERSDEESTGLSGFYSPLVLSIANKEKVSLDELKSIKGSGLNGRVTKNDILSFIEKRKEGKAQPAKKEEAKTVPAPIFEPASKQVEYSSGEVERIPMDNIRLRIMQHMVASRDTSVHVSAMLEVDMTKIHNFIQKNRDEFQQREGIKLTYMAFIASACVKGLKEFPLINASIENNMIIRKKFINLGIAVAIEPTGLIVPNIKAADEKNLTGLAKAINDLAFRSRNKKLSPDDISNGTFTITNYGVFGTIFGTPIINQPEVAILGVGTVTKKPVVAEVDGNDVIAIKPIMALTLSHDHRLVDGMLGGKFLKFMKDTLENFDENYI